MRPSNRSRASSSTKFIEVYSQKFQTGDFDESEKFDPKILPNAYLTNPKAGDAFVYVCTIQRMTINLFGKGAGFSGAEEDREEDAEEILIPNHAFDVVIADECHRGYTAQELAVWKDTLDHFDAIKIGLTATPAAHTTTYFHDVVFRYEYNRAVDEGYLVDYDVVSIKSNIRMKGAFLDEGELVGYVDTETGAEQLDHLEAERNYDVADIETVVTVPDSNQKILEEIRKYALEHEEKYGRLPKTLIFADNDLPHTSHADELVKIARDTFGRGDAFVQKITGRVDRPLQRIREFRNRPEPVIAVTVDLLSTGVDIPDLEYIVFLRPVKSRILFEQMMGRGTRKGEKYPDKSHFTVFDCFDGTLLAYFQKSTGITATLPIKKARTLAEIIEDIWQNRDRDYNIHCLVKRLQRIDKEMAGSAREEFAAFIPDGDLRRFAAALSGNLRKDFPGSMKLLRDPAFQNLLVNYPRPKRMFLKGYETVDEVSSVHLIKDAAGKEYKPADYLTAFGTFIKENEDKIEAVRILLKNPGDWGMEALMALRKILAASPFGSPRISCRRSTSWRTTKPWSISFMVSMLPANEEGLFTAQERVQRAMMRITGSRKFTPEQMQWLERSAFTWCRICPSAEMISTIFRLFRFRRLG